ncbi:sugar transferase [Streptomyces sp. NPDC051569]|uniref:sugar transferase n=1 Tax=Streptomyces sp. NPDC051569 TaxID=3365661 RepID=UPI0037915A5D
MTTESTSVPPPAGRARTVGRSLGRISLASPPRTARDRTAPEPAARDRTAPPSRRRPAGAPLRFGLPLIAGDGLAALLSTAVLSDEQREAVLLPLLVCVTVLNACAGLYRPGVVLSGLDQLPALGARITVSWCAAAAVLAALLPGHALGIAALLGGAVAQLVVACCCRSLVHGRRRAAARGRLRSTLVVGTGPAARRMTALLARHPEYGLRPVGIAALTGDDAALGASPGKGVTDAPDLPVLTSIEEIHRAVIQNGVEEAVFLESWDSGSWDSGSRDSGGAGTGTGGGTDRAPLVALFHEYGCATWFVGDGPRESPAVPRSSGGLTAPAAPDAMARHLWGFAGHRVEPPAPRRRGTVAKRALDMTIAAPILLAISPLLLACALAVRLCDGPGVLFRQERVGQDGRPFTLLKFRTLRPADEQEAATRWNIAHDRRMSAVGRLLRRTSMDELPQLWNVLRGDMSLVGPRPERPFFVANFSRTTPGYAARHRMPVGITGLAQVHGLRGDTSIEERSRFDNHYIDHWSLWQDVCILVRTAVSLVRPAGS